MQIKIPNLSVVLVLADKRQARVAEICDAIGGISCPWDINNPDSSIERLHEAMVEKKTIRVAMRYSHEKARSQVASAARKRGFTRIALRLPGAEEVDPNLFEVHNIGIDDKPEFITVQDACDMSALPGPFDFIGDVHGCLDELKLLAIALGHAHPATGDPIYHPDRRTAVLLGDLVDRGPSSLETMRYVQRMEACGALRVLGNHDQKIARHLCGQKIEPSAGNITTIIETNHLDRGQRLDLGNWLNSAQTHLILDGGRVVAAHAGLEERDHGSMSQRARAFALYGRASGELNEQGHVVRDNWAADYTGEAYVVHGHVVHEQPHVHNKVVAIDTGCVFGGDLTAFRWPEMTFLSIPAAKAYSDGTDVYEGPEA